MRSNHEAAEKVRLGGSGAWLRRAPLGILVVGFALLLLGAGFVAGGVYLGLARADTGWVAWGGAVVIGPLLFYVAVHLLRLSSWAWLALVGLMALLLASALARFLLAGPHPLAPLLEMCVEIVLLVYLTRPSVRRAFGRGRIR